MVGDVTSGNNPSTLPKEFDLTRFSRVGYSPVTRATSIAMTAGLVVLAIVGAMAMALHTIALTIPAVQIGAVVACGLMAVVVAVATWRRQGLGAHKVIITQEGVEFQLSPSLHRVWRWDSRNLDVKLVDGTENPSFPQEMKYLSWEPAFGLRDSFLSKEAFDAILQSAREKGLQITRTPTRTIRGPAILIRIQSKPPPPPGT
jgi:hypothetical protein